MALISELPIFQVAQEAEEKHGVDTHMVIEVVLKPYVAEALEGDDEDYDPSYVGEDDVYWWVEFENEIKVFDSFAVVKDYLLNKAVKTGDGPTVEFRDEDLNGEELSYEGLINGNVD
jgi:hypothetical protein|tara:strand:+ start:16755 stop:17105 length:351 start_codon:yes stop_codon:yes gene_type:complete